jgi:anthranilate phosphoribosyltransferase
MASNRALKVETPEQSRAMLLGVLAGDAARARDIVCLNAGARCTPPTWCPPWPRASPRRAPPSTRARQSQARSAVTRTHALAVA